MITDLRLQITKLSSQKQLTIASASLSHVTYDVETPTPQDPPFCCWYRDSSNGEVVLSDDSLRESDRFDNLGSCSVSKSGSSTRVTVIEPAIDAAVDEYDSLSEDRDPQGTRWIWTPARAGESQTTILRLLPEPLVIESV